MSKLAIRTWAAAGLAVVVAATSLYVPEASAHGEKSQQAFLRMRTLHWYDLNWSTDKLRVNEKMTVSGKIHVFKNWPETTANPEHSPAFLNIGIPGPVFTRVESYMGGQFVPRSVNLELGKNYTFKVVLQARRPGRWHMHTMMNVEAAGPIIGPGIDGSMADYKHVLTTLTGNTVDIEKVGTAGIWGWSFFWIFFGFAWIGYWAAKPVFVPRYMARKAGDESIVSPTDVKVGLGFMVATLIITWVGYNAGNSANPITIPLQAGVIGVMEPIPEGAPTVEAKVEQATYRVPGRSVILKVRVNNRGISPVQVAEFETAGIRFLNGSVYKDETNYPPQLLAPEGLSVDDNSPILPGQSKVITLTGTDAAWENERIADVIYDPDSRFGGLLFFVDSSGFRSMAAVGGPLLPRFT
ncbi:MAG: Particulate methane monooxygenase alpha subunit [Chromatiales bacterium USCg_Taylor]|nr:MAG: Particulate methane monooxygenase alpha subunit [Chromatiales bacterium USCg_Taylor]